MDYGALDRELDLALGVAETEVGELEQLDFDIDAEDTPAKEERPGRFQRERLFVEPSGLDRALPTNPNEYDQQLLQYQQQQQQRASGTLPIKYANKGGGFVTGFDTMSAEELSKKANRANRFGTLVDQPSPAQGAEEGEGMDVDMVDPSQSNLPESPPRTAMVRQDAIHLYGTDAMSTKDVLKYFEEYGPSHVEWIDDSSCNVVFRDSFSAKRALYNLILDKTATFGEDQEGMAVKDEDTDIGQDANGAPVILVPKSQNKLRRARTFIPVQQVNTPILSNNAGLYIRYATDYDIKARGAAQRSTYYMIHGREEPSNSGSRSGSILHQHQYGRRSREDDDEIWNRGRGLQTMSRLQRKMEGEASPSPPPRDRRARGRDDSGSRSRSRSRSPENFRRERSSRSPERTGSRAKMDEYDSRGRRKVDILSRLGERVDVDEEADTDGGAGIKVEEPTRKEGGLYSDQVESVRPRMISPPRPSVRREWDRDKQSSGSRDRDRDRDRDRERDRDGDRNSRRRHGRSSNNSRSNSGRNSPRSIESRLGGLVSKSASERMSRSNYGEDSDEERDEFGRSRR